MKQTVKLSLLLELEKHAVSCSVEPGYQLLDELFRHGEEIEVPDDLAPRFRLVLSYWTELGYRNLPFLIRVNQRLGPADYTRLPVLDFLRLRMASAYELFAQERFEPALELFDQVLRVGTEILPPQMAYSAHCWKGRAHRRKGDYDLIAPHYAAARAIATSMNAPKLVAAVSFGESWLSFQKGECKLAFQLLDQAEAEIRSMNNPLWLGNVESARGRFIRRSGEYERALKHFEAAIELYSGHYSQHPVMARALINAAYIKRLMSLDIQGSTGGGQFQGGVHARYLRISREALDLLKQAEAIYRVHNHEGGLGRVFMHAGHLHLESGDIDSALAEGKLAYEIGYKRKDTFLLSRARTLQSAAELALSEEQIGKDATTSADNAVQYANESIEFASQTQDKRLLAEAYLALGRAAANEQFQDWDKARDCAAKAGALLNREDRDHLHKQLGQLKAMLLRSSTGIDETLRQWSEGRFGEKTFVQIQEEFAELVIPKIWANLGHSVSRVARKYSISPKKVRRILQSAGLSSPHVAKNLSVATQIATEESADELWPTAQQHRSANTLCMKVNRTRVS